MNRLVSAVLIWVEQRRDSTINEKPTDRHEQDGTSTYSHKVHIIEYHVYADSNYKNIGNQVPIVVFFHLSAVMPWMFIETGLFSPGVVLAGSSNGKMMRCASDWWLFCGKKWKNKLVKNGGVCQKHGGEIPAFMETFQFLWDFMRKHGGLATNKWECDGISPTHLVMKCWCDKKSWEFSDTNMSFQMNIIFRSGSWRCVLEPIDMGKSFRYSGGFRMIAIGLRKLKLWSTIRFGPFSRQFHIWDILRICVGSFFWRV